MTDAIRCARCEQHLDPEAFAPSQRKPGAYCRACRKEYMRPYNSHRYYADKPTLDCVDCGETYERWCEWAKPGAAGRRCNPCYLAYTRKRQSPARRGHAPVPPPGTRINWSTAAGRALRARIYAEETHCAICGGWVDKTIKGPSRWCPSIDHIVPVAQGGSNERDNLRLTHFTCNAKAGSGIRAITPSERRDVMRLALVMATTGL